MITFSVQETHQKLSFNCMSIGACRIVKLHSLLCVIAILALCFSSCENQQKSNILFSYIIAIEQNDSTLQKEILEENKSDINLISAMIVRQKDKHTEFKLNALCTKYRDAETQLYSTGLTQAFKEAATLASRTEDNPASNWLSFQIIYEHIVQELNQAKVVLNLEEDLRNLKRINFEHSTIQQYTEIMITSLESEIDYHSGNTTAAIIAINKCLSKLQNTSLTSTFPSLEFELHSIYLSFLAADKSLDSEGIYKNFLRKKLNQSPESNLRNTYTKDYYKLETLDGRTRPDSTISFLKYLDKKYPPENISFNRYLNLQILAALKWEDIDHKMAIQVWSKLDRLSILNKCNSAIYIGLLSRLYYAKGQLEYKAILDKIKPYDPCFIENPYLEYLNYLFTADDPYENTDNLSKIQGISNQRQLAKKMWGTEPNFHLLDLYALNTVDYLEQFSKLSEDDQFKLQAEIPVLFTETKAIELKLKRAVNNLNFSDSNAHKRLSELIRQTNDCTDTLYHGHPIYLEIYDLYQEKQKSDEKEQVILSKNTKQAQSFDQLLGRLKTKNTTVVNFLKYDSTYWAFTLSSDTFSLKKINAIALDELTQTLHQALYERKEIGRYQEELKLLLPIIPTTERLLIIPDASLSTLPFELVYQIPEEIQYHFDLYEWSNQQEKTIKTEKGAIFSYSDQETINSLKPRTFTELPIGLQECKSIHSLLSEAPSIDAGLKFTKQRLSQKKNADFIHFSTHAAMNKRNRLDNYLLIRNEEGNPEQLFSYEIEQWAESPTVVIFSACDTGQGFHKIAEGSYSLSRGFLLAGSETVIKSLWQVNEAATAEFMRLLYSNWITNMTVSQALKETKKIMSTNEKYSHPYYWSGFVLEGNSDIFLQ